MVLKITNYTEVFALCFLMVITSNDTLGCINPKVVIPAFATLLSATGLVIDARMGRKEAKMDYEVLKTGIEKKSEDIVGLKTKIVGIGSKIDSVQAISLGTAWAIMSRLQGRNSKQVDKWMTDIEVCIKTDGKICDAVKKGKQPWSSQLVGVFFLCCYRRIGAEMTTKMDSVQAIALGTAWITTPSHKDRNPTYTSLIQELPPPLADSLREWAEKRPT